MSEMQLGPVDYIVKLGGSAITKKESLETLKEEELKGASRGLAASWKNGSRFVVVHGAGSFGHHQAKQYRVNDGWKNETDELVVKEGFCQTRLSVCKLNQIVVASLVSEGVPAVAVSPCGSWIVDRGHVIKDGSSQVLDLLDSGFVPVMHGDCVLDKTTGCRILSGDTITQVLCKHLHPSRVIFLSDVLGVYSKPPSVPGATLLPEVKVSQDGSLSVPVETGSIQHDVTGGLELKLASAVNIVREGGGRVDVVVCGVGSSTFDEVCSAGGGRIRTTDGPGTVISLE